MHVAASEETGQVRSYCPVIVGIEVNYSRLNEDELVDT